MKSIIISSNCSGGGKTTFTLGLMKVLKSRKLDVQGYKVGPDYIDTAFHREVTKKASRNLDIFLMGEEGMKKSFLNGIGDVGVIEGVMGLYDGIGASEKASTYEVSKVLGNMPIILVLSPKGQSSSICAEINGFKNYRNANIVGVVLNSVSEKYFNLLKYAIEKNCNTKVFGYLPKNSDIALSSRHLGLVQSMEVLNLHEKLEICENIINEHIDVAGILNEMQDFKGISEINLLNDFKGKKIIQKKHVIKLNDISGEKDNFKTNAHIDKEKNESKILRIGVALDKAFSFYYKDNLELLEQYGKLIYFSPIEDKTLPENLDFLYIGGGYPEVFKDELESNYSMRNSIKTALDNGLRCYAECGGLMYLTKSIDGSQMVGFFDGESIMTNKLQNFGYCKVKINKKYFHKYSAESAYLSNSEISKQNASKEALNKEIKVQNLKYESLKDNIEALEFEINAHEFHKSQVNIKEENVYEVEKTLYNGDVIKWRCGYFKKNTLAGYAHINFLGNLELLKALIG